MRELATVLKVSTERTARGHVKEYAQHETKIASHD